MLASYTQNNDEERLLLTKLNHYFDPVYYRGSYDYHHIPDMMETRNLFHNFMTSGWKDGRSPSRLFDTIFYLSTNPDVVELGINPLLHYVLYGKKEGRRAIRPQAILRQEFDESAKINQQSIQWTGEIDPASAITLEKLSTLIKAAIVQNRLLLSISHDDYKMTFGGVQNLIEDEQLAFARHGWTYLHISPTVYPVALADDVTADMFVVSLRLNGKLIGRVPFSYLLELASLLIKDGCQITVIVHHLMRSSPELITQLIQRTNERPIIWVHDLFSLCPSYSLLRNHVTPCGAPNMDSISCMICDFGKERKNHIRRIQEFFRINKPDVIAPSQTALDKWLQQGHYAYDKAAVVPVARLLMDNNPMPIFPPQTVKKPLRVAHIGARVFHKGWSTFEKLALEYADSGQYEFYQLGYALIGSLPGCVKHIAVETTHDNRDAMISTMLKHRIDVVINWSMCAETFSFTAHEALAGGAFLIARKDAGNVWPAIQQNCPEQGMAVETEEELIALFADSKFTQKLTTAPRRLGFLFPAENTAHWIMKTRN